MSEGVGMPAKESAVMEVARHAFRVVRDTGGLRNAAA
jgi:hypothetical protein